MAKGTPKSKTKVTPSAPTTSSKSKLKSGPPEPYTIPPPALRDFLESLNPKHVYLTHIDKHPKSKKTSVWLLTAALNVVVTLGLLWRINYILPWYIEVLMSMWGYQSPLDVRGQATSALFGELWSRSGTFILDFFLIRYGLTWPFDFFIGATSPLNWRMSIGFQEQEIAVRRSRKWDDKLGKDWLEGTTSETIHRDIIMPAIDRSWISGKTSYLMVDKYWDLDFRLMVKAEALVKKDVNKLDDFQKTVILHHETFGWLVWQVWKLDEGAHTEGRQKIVEMREKLSTLGKEDLFFRWVELIQFETSQPGGFTPERQTKAMQEARELFNRNGVDFDALWKDIGGGSAPDLSGTD